MDYSQYETYDFDSRSAFNMYTGNKERSYHMHWHSYGEIVLVGPGDTNIFMVNQNTYKLVPGDFVLMWPMEMHAIIDADREKAMVIQFSNAFMNSLFDLQRIMHLYRNLHVICINAHRELVMKLQGIVQKMTDIFYSNANDRELKCCMLLMEFMLKLLEYRKELSPELNEDEQYGYTDEQFDEFMRTIRVTIKYNLISSETITVTANDPVTVVNATQAREIGRDDLYGIAKFREYYPVITSTYDGTSYPVGKVSRTFKTAEIWNKALEVIDGKYPTHGDDLYISEGYFFYHYTHTKGGIAADQTGKRGYFLFDGEELLGLLVSGLETGYEYYDISQLGSFRETVKNRDYFELIDQENGNTLMIWTANELIAINNDKDIKEYEGFFNEVFPTDESVEPFEREWKNLYNHRFVLEF